MSDPLDTLLPPEGVTPGLWRACGEGAVYVNEADAQHIATWDPDTAREVVALLQGADTKPGPGWASQETCEACGRTGNALQRSRSPDYHYCGGGSHGRIVYSYVRSPWGERLDALRARVAERRGE